MSKPKPLLFISIFLLLTFPTHSLPIPFIASFTKLRTLHSLLHSLSTRVTTLRTSRGDLSGAHRANLITRALDALTSPKVLFSVSWDFLRLASDIACTSDVKELVSSLSELNSLNSNADRAAWVATNYMRVIESSKSLLKAFSKSGAVREMVETLQREILDGEFFKDCVEVGGNDLKGLFGILKDLHVALIQKGNVHGHQEL